MKKVFIVLFIQVFVIGFCFSQEETNDTLKTEQLYVITKLDGTEYIGKILSDDGREVLIETEALGKIYIPKSDIKSIVKIEDGKSIVYGEFQNVGPFTTRYAFTTNALPIIKGENYALINLYGPEVHFALTDHFNIGIMSTWMASPMVLAAKYSIKTGNEKINLSLGTLMGTSGYLNTFRGFGGLHFGNITFGSRKKNITIGAGYAYLQTGNYSSFVDPGTYLDEYPNLYVNMDNNKVGPMSQGPIFSIAGITTAGAKASFIFDSMIGIFSSVKNNIVDTEITAPGGYYNPNPPYEWIYVPGLYQHDVTNVSTGTVALFLMPGMRFQTKENHAFQCSLAGVAVFRYKGYSGFDENFSFPVPMCTWFFRF